VFLIILLILSPAPTISNAKIDKGKKLDMPKIIVPIAYRLTEISRILPCLEIVPACANLALPDCNILV